MLKVKQLHSNKKQSGLHGSELDKIKSAASQL